MRVVVIKEFIDKNTSVRHEIGEKLTVTEERFAELKRAGKYVIDITDEIGQQETTVVPEADQEAETEQEAEVNQEAEEKPPKGRRNRGKSKESEDR